MTILSLHLSNKVLRMALSSEFHLLQLNNIFLFRLSLYWQQADKTTLTPGQDFISQKSVENARYVEI